jgi:hypothetical protein
MDWQTACGEAPVPFVFYAVWQKKRTANKRIDNPLKKMLIRTDLCYSVDEANG